VVVPRQKGTSTECCALGAEGEEIDEWAKYENLIVLGWIHTHPELPAYLSTPDVHTSLVYQLGPFGINSVSTVVSIKAKTGLTEA
jgi:proteasome lid subunit RPN8/RPN11